MFANDLVVRWTDENPVITWSGGLRPGRKRCEPGGLQEAAGHPMGLFVYVRLLN